MADLGSLDIRITASAGQAEKALGRLSSSLEAVGRAIIPASNGVDKMADALDRLVANNASLNQTVKALKDVAKASATLSASSRNENPFAGVTAGLEQLQGINLSGTLQNLTYIKETVSKLGGASGTNASTSLMQIANGLRAFDGLVLPNFGDSLTNLSLGLRSLGSGNIVAASQALPYITEGLRELSGVTITTDVGKIADLAHAISRFGLANMEKAIANMPVLATSLNSLITNISKMPQVSDNTVRLVEALSHLNVNSLNASNGVTRLSGSLKTYSGHAKKAQKVSTSLAAVIGKVYASYWLLFRLFSKFGESIKLASDLTEVQNVVDVTFGNMNKKMNEFAKNAVDTLGMSELTAKQIGSRFQAMGSAMGISKDMIKDTNAFVQSATKGYAQVSDSMADLSINLTKLAGDMASFYNAEYSDVAKDLEAVMTGMTRPLRKYGLDLTVATLKEFALANGLNADIKSMTQAEKTLLRYQYVMANTSAAHGDFKRTQDTWANSIKIATERLKQLGIVLGKIAIYSFKPLVQSFNKAMESIIKSAEGLLNALGKIFGWKIEWSDGGQLRDEEEGLEDIADGYEDATKAGKKFKNFLLGIDELNLLPDNSDDNGGKDNGLGGIGDMWKDLESGLKITPIEKGFDSLYDTLFKLGRKIADVLKNLLKSIDWDAVYKKARRFGKGLAQFLNGLLLDSELFYEIGKFFAGGINTIANALDAFHKEFSGWQLGVDIGSLVNGFTKNLDWNVIRSASYEMAHDIAQTINAAFVTIDWKMVGSTIANGLNTIVDFFYTLGDEINWKVVGNSIATGINSAFKTFDFAKAGQALGKWARGLLDAIISVLEKTDWKKIGNSIGTFIANIDLGSVIGKIGVALWDAINAAVSAYGGLFKAAPITTALITAFSSKSLRTKLGKGLGTLATFISDSLSSDIGSLLSGKLFSVFGQGFMSAPIGGNTLSTFFNGVSGGFNALSASLNGVTKAVGGVTVGFAEFFTVKDAVYNLVHGTDNLAGSILELGAAVGVASVAMSALLGVPTGLIIVGATAATAAIVGITKAMEDLREENAVAGLTKDMGDAYSSLGNLVGKYTEVTEDITGGLDKLNGEYEKVESLGSKLNDIAGGYSLVVSAIDGGNRLTSEAMEELIGNIEDVKSAWEDYINSQYSYLIQSTRNDYQFAKSQGILTEEMEQAYIDRINSLTTAREDELEELNRLIEDLDKANGYYQEVVKQGANGSALEFAEKEVRNASKAVLDFGSATGAVANGDLREFEDGLNEISNMKIDFSDIDATDYATALEEADGYFNQLTEQYDKAKQRIETDIQYRMKSDPTLTEEQARKDAQMYYDALNKATKESIDTVQISLYDILVSSMGTSRTDYVAVHEINENLIKPIMEDLTKTYEEVANGEKPKLESIVFNMFKDSLKIGWHGNTVQQFSDNWKEVADQYRKELTPISDESKKITDSSNKSLEKLGEGAKGGANNLKNINYAMADMTKQSSLFLQGMTGVSGALADTATKGRDIEQVSTGFKAIGQSVTEFIGQLPMFQSSFGNTSSVMKENITGIDTSFSKMFLDVQANGMKMLTWFKSGFTSYFSASYWSGLLSGIPRAFQNAFTQAVNVAKNIWMQFAQWANQNMKMNVSGQKNGGGAQVKVQFPAYAKGGFPEDGMFFANHTEMVGKFSNGKTAVANNEQITDGIKQGVYEAVMSAMSASGGSGGNVTVELRGDASDIFSAVVKENNRSIMRTGKSPMRI